MGIQKRHISSYSAHVNGRVEKPNQSLANILASISQNTNDWDEQLPHTMLASVIHEATFTSPFFLEHGRDIRLSYTYEKNSDTPQNKYEYVEKLLPSLEQIFNKVLNNLKDQEASHVDLSTRATRQHHYDYKIVSFCFIKTPNIKSNLSPKLRPKFEGPYRFSRLLWRCCTAGAPSIPCSVHASATSSGRHTHMITELSSCDGTILFRICRSLQEQGHLPSSRTGCRLLWRCYTYDHRTLFL
ncbi:integrase catalytic domain-containing protein [Trichonephila clavipes]|nr:integrase catalytic domain-containing protein [Trichonephila clavipes]